VTDEKSRIVCVRLSVQDYNKLKELSERQGRTVSDLIRAAISMLINPADDEKTAVHEEGHISFGHEDLETVRIAEKLVFRLIGWPKPTINVDQLRAILKTIKPALSPIQEQNVIYLLQGLRVLQPIGSSPLVTDPKRRVGLFRLEIPDVLLEDGLMRIFGHNGTSTDRLIL